MRFGIVAKLAISLTFGTAVVLATYGWLAVRRELSLFEQGKREYGDVLGRTLAQQVAKNWLLSGRPTALESLNRFDQGERRIRVRWVSLGKATAAEHDAQLDEATLEQLRAGKSATFARGGETGHCIYTYIPVPVADENAGAIEIVETLDDQASYTTASMQRLGLALLACVLLSALISVLLSAWLVGRPIDRLITKAAQVGGGHYDAPIDIHRRDEIGRLAQAMRDMSTRLLETREKLRNEEAARRKTEQHLQHAERLTTIGKLAAGVAHELGTPLNVIAGHAKRILRQSSDDEVTKGAQVIREQAERITQIVRQLLDFARRKGPSSRDVRVARLFEEVAVLLEAAIRKYDKVELRFSPSSEDLCVSGDSLQLQQVLSNLVLNAAQSMPGGGVVELGAEVFDGTPAPGDGNLPAGRYVRLFVRDEGQGIPEELRQRIFEPFFTTKDVGEGTGLGLSVVYGIVNEHGGCIEVDSVPQRGSCFSVYLPRASTATVAA